MTIIFYIDALKLGGAERIVLRWAQWCVLEGWRVVVLTRHGPERDAYPLPEGAERWQEVRLPPWQERMGWWAFPLRVQALRRQLRHEHVDLLVGVTTLPAVKLLLASRGLGVPCVVSERNYPPAKLPPRPWRALRRLTYPWADLHLVQTSTTGAWLRRHCGARRQCLLPNPVTWPLPDREPIEPPDQWLDPGALVLLAAGTKAHQKGFDRLIPIFVALARREPQLRLVLLGLSAEPYHGRDQQAWLRQRLDSLDSTLQSRLVMPGAVGNMAAWYARASLFVLPSRYEGFPNVLLEAMAAGCACVASDCATGPRDLITDHVNGLLLPPEASTEQWVSVLAALLEDHPRRRRLGMAAQAVRRRFDPERLRCDFLEALSRIHDG